MTGSAPRPRHVPLWCRAGTALVASVTVGTVVGGPLDLTGVVVTLQIAPQAGATPAFTWAGEPVVAVDGPAGRIDLAVPVEATEQMRGYQGRWEWALIAKWPHVDPVLLVAGPLTVSPELVS